MCDFWYFEVVGENEKARLVSVRERERERDGFEKLLRLNKQREVDEFH